MRVGKPDGPSFGYRHELKTHYLKGRIKVKTGFYGGKLTKDTVTLEHLKPKSKGGKTELSNLVLVTRRNNEKRSNFPLKDFLNKEAMELYLSYFEDVKLPGFDGNKYIDMIRRTVRKLTGGKNK